MNEIMNMIFHGYFPTGWKRMAVCKSCGFLISDISFNNESFLIDFNVFCDRCGIKYSYDSLEIIDGRLVFAGKWYKPQTWFDVKIIEQGDKK